MNYTPEQVSRLIANTEPWLSCDGCFDEIDVCVEALVAGAAEIAEPLRVHLARCPVCFEEAETLLTLAARDQGADAGAVLDTLRHLI